MDKKIRKMKPNYRRLFTDILDKKYPDKKPYVLPHLRNNNLTHLEIIHINQLIFGTDKKNNNVNQKYKTYTKSDILKILAHQKRYSLNNSEVATHFKLSRNTITKWKKLYP